MANNLKKILRSINKDEGKLLNTLIEQGILTLDVLENAVFEIGNAEILFWYVKYINGVKEEAVINRVKQRSCGFIIEVAKYFQPYVKTLANEIIKSKDAWYIYKFARDVSNAPIEKLADAIIETGNAEYIYLFTRDVSNAPIEKLADAVIELKYVEYIYYFARDVSLAPIGKLADATIEAKDEYYIYGFINNVKNAPIENLIEALLELGYINRYSFVTLICLQKHLPFSLYDKIFKKLMEFGYYEEILIIISDCHFEVIIQGQEESSNLSNYILLHIDELIAFMMTCKDKELLRDFEVELEKIRELKQLELVKKVRTSEELMVDLIQLYQKGDFEAIREKRDEFNKLFVEEQEELGRK